MGLSFRSPHRDSSILGSGSFTSNFSTAKPDKVVVAVNLDIPACVGIEKRPRRR